jgi:hypothetical protein
MDISYLQARIYSELYGAHIYFHISIHNFIVHVDANIEGEADVATPTEDRSTRLIQMTSQVIGLTYSKEKFSNELAYMHTMAQWCSKEKKQLGQTSND